jgi:hypothetical protein
MLSSGRVERLEFKRNHRVRKRAHVSLFDFRGGGAWRPGEIVRRLPKPILPRFIVKISALLPRQLSRLFVETGHLVGVWQVALTLFARVRPHRRVRVTAVGVVA